MFFSIYVHKKKVPGRGGVRATGVIQIPYWSMKWAWKV